MIICTYLSMVLLLPPKFHPIFSPSPQKETGHPRPSQGTFRIAATSSSEKKPGYLPMCTCRPVDSLVAARRGARRKAEVMSQNKVTSRSLKLILSWCWTKMRTKMLHKSKDVGNKYMEKKTSKKNTEQLENLFSNVIRFF